MWTPCDEHKKKFPRLKWTNGECTMNEQNIQEKQSQEMVSLGMAFMGFLMAMGAICGVWFVSGLIVVLTKLTN